MGASLSNPFTGGSNPSKEDSAELDKVCEVTGLTGRDKKGIRDTWELVKKDAKGNAVDVFIKFFTMFPEYQKLFKSFSTVPLSDLKKNKTLEAHATVVIYTLTSLVDNLDDIECLKELLLKIGNNHGRRKITVKQFEDLTTVVISFLEEKIPPKQFTPATKEAWRKAFVVINSIIAQGLESQKADKANGT